MPGDIIHRRNQPKPGPLDNSLAVAGFDMQRAHVQRFPRQLSEIISHPKYIEILAEVWNKLAEYLDNQGTPDPRDSQFSKNIYGNSESLRELSRMLMALAHDVKEFQAQCGDRIELMLKVKEAVKAIDHFKHSADIAVRGSLSEFLSKALGDFDLLRAPINSEEEFVQRFSKANEVLRILIIDPWAQFEGIDFLDLFGHFGDSLKARSVTLKKATRLGGLKLKLSMQWSTEFPFDFAPHVPYPYTSALFIRADISLRQGIKGKHLIRGFSFFPLDDFEVLTQVDPLEMITQDFKKVVFPSLELLLNEIGKLRERSFDPRKDISSHQLKEIIQRYLGPIGVNGHYSGPHAICEVQPRVFQIQGYEGYPYLHQRYRCPPLLTADSLELLIERGQYGNYFRADFRLLE